MRHLDAALARYLAFECTPTQKEILLQPAVRATTLTECTQLLCARRTDFLFLETLQFFGGSRVQNLRDPNAGRFLFSDLNAMLTQSTLRDIFKYAQRTLAECTQFLCAGRAGFPEILQIFRAIFCAKYASSRRCTRALSCIRANADSKRDFITTGGSRNHAD